MANRLFVSIAVSKPRDLKPLPGALTAGRRMAKWAEANGYEVIVIDDSEGTPVTVDRISDQLADSIEKILLEEPLQRLVIFFAGHGATRTVNDPYWLLSDWCVDWSEAINVTALQRVLYYYGPRQVALIGDCCRVVHKKFQDVLGSAILKTTDEDAVQYETDRFFAADAGEESFMIRAEGSQDAFCIFTEVLLDALEGDAPDAYELGPSGERIVTSGSLARHLLRAVPLEASKHNVSMIPKPEPGFFTDPVYVRLPPAAAKRPDGPPSGPIDRVNPRINSLRRVDGAAAVDKARVEREQSAREDQAKRMVEGFEPQEIATHFETACGLTVLGAGNVRVSASRGRVLTDPNRPGTWFPIDLPPAWGGATAWTDLLIETDEGRTAYACAVHEFVTTLQLQGEDGTILFHHPVWDHPDSSHDVVEVLAWLNAGMLREEHIPDLAIRLRNRKHFDFTLGCVAAYLYDSIADIGNVRSIAWHYHRRQQPVPLDVALLCGGRIRALDDGSLTVDIPSAQRRAARTEQERRRDFATRETPAVEGAAIAGRVPWLRNGWSAIPTALVDDNAAGWRDHAMNVMEHLARSPFTSVEPDGRALLFGLAGVELPAAAALAEA